MTSEAKVRQVWPDAVCWRNPKTKEYRLVYSDSTHSRCLGTGNGEKRRAWAAAWRTIERQHAVNVAKVEARWPGHRFNSRLVNNWILSGENYIAHAPGHPYHVYALAAKLIDEQEGE